MKIYADTIGSILRFFFVYKGNRKKMKAADIENWKQEEELNTQWGTYFILCSVAIFALLYNLL